MRDGGYGYIWEAVRGHELVVQRCKACATFQFTPEWICHKCHTLDVGWHRVSGRARVYSWERVWHPAHPALKSACPYLVVVVEPADAGKVRMVGNLPGDPVRTANFEAEADAGSAA